jgi:tetrapyrrole methylase family protein/MazG family protein/ATP diphosphatase
MTPPPARDESSNLPGLTRLLATVARLRAPDGCPWDRKQTTTSMAQSLVEEAFEAADALRSGDDLAAGEELGDVLVNVALIGQIAGEAGRFAVDDVADRAAQKLVRRHSHVFGDVAVDGAEMAYRNWERMKRAERGDGPRSVLAGVPSALPALQRALRMGEKAARAGFDWPDRAGPRSKLDEELAELDEAVAAGDERAIRGELGDVLFSLCNLARHLGINPEMALADACDKFQRRFGAVEREFGYELHGHPLEELDAAWVRAKERGE